MPPAKTAPATMETTLAAIVAHPTRARAFLILAERTASPAEIAKEIGKDVGHVGYHVRKLQQLDLIELVDEKPVRGAVEHFYRAIERPMVTEEEFAGAERRGTRGLDPRDPAAPRRRHRPRDGRAHLRRPAPIASSRGSRCWSTRRASPN